MGRSLVLLVWFGLTHVDLSPPFQLELVGSVGSVGWFLYRVPGTRASISGRFPSVCLLGTVPLARFVLF